MWSYYSLGIVLHTTLKELDALRLPFSNIIRIPKFNDALGVSILRVLEDILKGVKHLTPYGSKKLLTTHLLPFWVSLRTFNERFELALQEKF